VPRCPLLVPGEPKPRPPLSCPLLAFGEPEPRPPLRSLVHWMPGLGSVEGLAEWITFEEFVSLSCPEFPDGTVSHPHPCGPRTPGLAEFPGHLETLRRRRSPSRSVVGPVVSPSGWRCLPEETGSGVDAQVVAPEQNSLVNLVG
jgi:hypothetical protein